MPTPATVPRNNEPVIDAIVNAAKADNRNWPSIPIFTTPERSPIIPHIAPKTNKVAAPNRSGEYRCRLRAIGRVEGPRDNNDECRSDIEHLFCRVVMTYPNLLRVGAVRSYLCAFAAPTE